MKILSKDLARPDATGDAAQTTQRMRVGMIGLAAVLLLIGFAAAMFATVTHERSAPAIGAANSETVANMVAGNMLAAREPLAELGVAPSATVDANATDALDNRAAAPTQ